MREQSEDGAADGSKADAERSTAIAARFTPTMSPLP